MAKSKKLYECQECGSQRTQWVGQCSDCSAWNSFNEIAVMQSNNQQLQNLANISNLANLNSNSKLSSLSKGYTGNLNSQVKIFSDICAEEIKKDSTGISELDRVLGGGLVSGSVILLGGAPGIGKSTLLLHALAKFSELQKDKNVLYVTGEESLEQVVLRGSRLGIKTDNIKLLADICIENIIIQSNNHTPKILVVDSIQTLCSMNLSSAPGSVSQVRESAAQLVQYAKNTNTTVFIVGHVTKDGALAGPRVLEHMVDTVLYFEGDQDSKFRAIRAVKNRFGAVNELGVFLMSDKGLKEVNNPSAIFLQRVSDNTPGSVITVTWEGSRPMLVEVQALVDESNAGAPRRVTVGVDQNRVIMGLAILNRHGAVPIYDQDVFINVVSGVKITETAADLALICAVVSSLRNKAIPSDVVIFGELGLGGELRPVQNAQSRLSEAVKHGFKKAIIPKANLPKGKFAGLEIIIADKLSDVLQSIRNLD
tara:strand:+ start:6512 stop:7954 length:1443 start_codon:yes stop_codon:yes gene_type:complete